MIPSSIPPPILPNLPTSEFNLRCFVKGDVKIPKENIISKLIYQSCPNQTPYYLSFRSDTDLNDSLPKFNYLENVEYWNHNYPDFDIKEESSYYLDGFWNYKYHYILDVWLIASPCKRYYFHPKYNLLSIKEFEDKYIELIPTNFEDLEQEAILNINKYNLTGMKSSIDMESRIWKECYKLAQFKPQKFICKY